jgi:hypothetical protein
MSYGPKSRELQEELRRVRAEMERHEGASEAYETAGLQILELAQSAYSSYVTKNPREQARLVKTVVSNSTFDRGSLSPTYIKPFDVFATGGKCEIGSPVWTTVCEEQLKSWLCLSRKRAIAAQPSTRR